MATITAKASNIDEIENPAGYLIGCAKKIERSMGVRNRLTRQTASTKKGANAAASEQE